MYAQIALLIYGLSALITGKMNLGGGTMLTGNNARTLGLVAIAPLPLSLVLGLAIGLESVWYVEVAVLITAVIVIYVWGSSMREPDPDLDDV